MSKRNQRNKTIQEELVKQELDIALLLEFYQSAKQPISKCRSSMKYIQPIIEELFQKDYVCTIVDNEDGQLCPTYPYRICIPVGLKNCSKCEEKKELVPSLSKLKSHFASSSLGRGRGRFIAPVSLIHYHDINNDIHYARFSLRSASLIQKPETFLNKFTRRSKRLSQSKFEVLDNVELNEHAEEILQEVHTRKRDKVKSKIRRSDGKSAKKDSMPKIEFEVEEILDDESIPIKESLKPTRMEKIRKEDLSSLNGLGVSFIGDLMVEEKLKLLRILQAVSSEKADRKMRYTKFKIFAMPFPGYEYFAACNIYAMKLKESEPSKHHHEFLEDVSFINLIINFSNIFRLLMIFNFHGILFVLLIIMFLKFWIPYLMNLFIHKLDLFNGRNTNNGISVCYI